MIPPEPVLTPAEIEAVYAQGPAAVVALVLRLQEPLATQPALKTVEYQRVLCTCPAGGQATAGPFPPHAQAQLGYGPRLRALGVCRTAGPSAATLLTAEQEAATRLAAAAAQIRARLRTAPVAHFDETAVVVDGAGAWLHVAGTAALTDYSVQRGRGRAAMAAAGVLPEFAGTAVHDGYASYRSYACTHALCGAHLLRELEAVAAARGQGWARRRQEVLRRVARAAARARAADQAAVAPARAAARREQYRALVAAGQPCNPQARAPDGSHAQQSKAYNLLKRLAEQEG